MFIQFLFAVSLCSFAFLQTTYVSRTDGSSSKYDRRATTTDTERAGYLDGGKVLFFSLPPIPPQKTIRTKESTGYIWMKNNEAVELAIILKRFLQAKSMENIRVVLR